MILGFLRLFNWPRCSCISFAMFSQFFGVVCVFVLAVLSHILSQLVIFSVLFTFVEVLPITFQCLKSASSKLTVLILLHFLPFS